MENKSITLGSPIKHGGHEYASLTMREPKVRDSVNASKQASNKADEEVTLFANLCGVSPEVISEMSMRDYAKLQVIYKDFLS